MTEERKGKPINIDETSYANLCRKFGKDIGNEVYLRIIKNRDKEVKKEDGTKSN